MIDIHSHIIFDVDDGPKTEEASLALLQASYDQGVRTIISTSHRRKGLFETPESKIQANFQRVKELAKQVAPDLDIRYGAEIYHTESILDKLEQHIFPTLADSRFVLIEFSSATPYRDMHKALNKVLMLGLTPVIAHIERYNALENEAKKVRELINMGCLTQVNASHVLKPKLFGDASKKFKKRTQFFLSQDLVHFVASDMHSTDKRPSYMRMAYQVIEAQYGSAKAEQLFSKNQQLLLANELF